MRDTLIKNVKLKVIEKDVEDIIGALENGSEAKAWLIVGAMLRYIAVKQDELCLREEI